MRATPGQQPLLATYTSLQTRRGGGYCIRRNREAHGRKETVSLLCNAHATHDGQQDAELGDDQAVLWLVSPVTVGEAKFR